MKEFVGATDAFSMNTLKRLKVFYGVDDDLFVEHKRIIAKLEELLPLCGRLK